MGRDLRRRQRPQISPRDLKKSSRVRREQSGGPLKLAGERVPTETGYRVLGYKGRNYEMYYEVMLAGSASAFMMHKKKDRTIWIVGGQGFVTTKHVDQAAITRRIVSGDALTFERGVAYRLSTTASEQLEFFVSQSAKYESALVEVQPTDAPRQATADEMAEPTLDERLGTVVSKPQTRRRRSKAAMQQSRTHRRSPQVEETFKVVSDGGTAAEPTVAAVSAPGVNPQPSRGHFDEEGAG